MVLQIENIDDVFTQLKTLHPIVTKSSFSLSVDELLNENPSYVIQNDGKFIVLTKDIKVV